MLKTISSLAINKSIHIREGSIIEKSDVNNDIVYKDMFEVSIVNIANTENFQPKIAKSKSLI